MIDNLSDFRPIGFSWRGTCYHFKDVEVSREKCPKCGHEFEGGIVLVPPMPDPPPKTSITLTDPEEIPPEGP